MTWLENGGAVMVGWPTAALCAMFVLLLVGLAVLGVVERRRQRSREVVLRAWERAAGPSVRVPAQRSGEQELKR